MSNCSSKQQSIPQPQHCDPQWTERGMRGISWNERESALISYKRKRSHIIPLVNQFQQPLPPLGARLFTKIQSSVSSRWLENRQFWRLPVPAGMPSTYTAPSTFSNQRGDWWFSYPVRGLSLHRGQGFSPDCFLHFAGCDLVRTMMGRKDRTKSRVGLRAFKSRS